jgi:hypothetical protein
MLSGFADIPTIPAATAVKTTGGENAEIHGESLDSHPACFFAVV